MTHTIVGLFDSRSEAQAAMQELVQQGFIQENIDISIRNVSDSTDYTTADTVSSGTSAGGGISGFFNSLFGGDETTVNNYTNAANEADAILTVQVDSDERARQAAAILDRHGAIDVDERGAQYSGQNYGQSTSNQQNFTETANRTETAGTTENYANNERSTSIPVIEEQLEVGKQEVERGGARIRSRIVEKPVEANVRLREEHVVVNRHPVNRAVTDADMANFKEGDIELRERAEEAVVSKQARVVEEVEVGKQVTEREETIRDTVRRTDVDVQETDTDVTNNSDITTGRANNL
jgi:uncharacterized protein (TIGR02271 family)